MKPCYQFFLSIIGLLYVDYPSQATTTILADNYYTAALSYADTSISSTPALFLTQTTPIKPSSRILDEEAKLLRKTMRINAMVQRSWISSMIVPGLGQVYNRQYWKLPFLYLGFYILGNKIYSEHKEMNVHKRTKLMVASATSAVKQNSPTSTFTQKRINECRRTRDLFIIIATTWYVLNILDAYACAHDRIVNFVDDIDTIPPPPTQAITIVPTAYTSAVSISLPIRF